MNEIGVKPEISEVKQFQSEINEFKQIKPEEGMSFQEAKMFWNNHFTGEAMPDDNLFASDKSEIASEKIEDTQKTEVVELKQYYDDNGELYRIGNKLLPDIQYEINGYTYKTDELGRIISAEGILHLKEHLGRLLIKDSLSDIAKGDQKEGDQRGHIIGDQFDGSNGLENMIAQDAGINMKDYKNFENELAREVKEGKNVEVQIEPEYEGNSGRPDRIIVTYTIDGKENMRIFSNQRED
mgnify:FL=1